ncbi:MAG: lipopolysaccharide core heptose(I) kinase RfaP [Pseudomonadales bacterium]|nr:lipopolysaccharide core heptose(I) kinase RfaP [Pseudomonadales bacterium]NIX09895.1 lipopolysaccharide core heptose(I) kinase RfaP [Pseudomonadales bacterium]
MSGLEQVELRTDLDRRWRGSDVFAMVENLRGESVREMAGRSTIRFELDGAGFYAKRHFGAGWREIVKNLLLLRRPVLDAGNEYRAIRALSAAGVNTLEIVGFGLRGRNPATRRSFLITEELAPVQSLEAYALRWLEEPPVPARKRRLIEEVAAISRAMHGAGINHRDYYLCHLLMLHPDRFGPSSSDPRLFVVDLHRAEVRHAVPYRWLVKDLGSLLFSAYEIGLTRGDRLRFLETYFQMPWRDVLSERSGLIADVVRRADRLYRKGRRKGILPRQLAGLSPAG